MSATESIADFGQLAFDAIRALQAEIESLKAELERKDRELEFALMKLEAIGR